jgi:hypothetical protein
VEHFGENLQREIVIEISLIFIILGDKNRASYTQCIHFYSVHIAAGM